jgi:hypothetical protein
MATILLWLGLGVEWSLTINSSWCKRFLLENFKWGFQAFVAIPALAPGIFAPLFDRCRPLPGYG